ncbi:50S ribosomal protein L4 [candidate division WOR-1 bacterium RIFOXYA2_FULL_37_7]|uniref:Large ribosomal subunit protein uL4 n=1 Tax=candidate division WOR-1 bacterium RIFOXYB2_FULL_37_13 TaxID=1802579 RepID=A0A1F4SRW3_UNCSA|nr:MAG: 50S ribosomal protein L4 [candidate division WOR-1 bacterium RIFOXYA2_FULL_37_7]OGC23176.1 MAG: 50S ribosomal protein L4 [candidate division WOR-1 bacterium RIFOXYB2_FULL_37_13]
MMKLKIYDIKGDNSGELEAASNIFDVKDNEEVVHSTLRWFLNSRRAGTHSTLMRGEVSGGGIKPWKQKGTGRARAGSIRSPLWRHGGVIFGPKPRKYGFNLPKKVRKLALKVVLSGRAREGKIKIAEHLDIEQPKTKLMKEILEKFGLIDKKVLVISDKISSNLELASRNLKNLKVVNYKKLNVFDLLNATDLIITKSAVENFKEIF